MPTSGGMPETDFRLGSRNENKLVMIRRSDSAAVVEMPRVPQKPGIDVTGPEGLLGMQSQTSELARTAVIVGAFVVVVSLAASYAAYQRSRQTIMDSIAEECLSISRTICDLVEDTARRHQQEPKQIISEIQQLWGVAHPRFTESFLCVVNSDGNLAYHSTVPKSIGRYVGTVRLSGSQGPQTVTELLESGQNWAGQNINASGRRQLVGYAYLEPLNAMVVVHTPIEYVEQQIRSIAMPWAISMLLVVGGLLPLAIGLLHFSYRSAEESRQETLERLSASERKFRSLVEIMPCAVQRADREGRITFANETQADLLGQSRDQLLNKHLWDFAADEASRSALRHAHQEIAGGRIERTQFECSLRGPENSLREVEVGWCAESFASDEPGEIICVVSDVTERVTAARDLRQFNELLESKVESRTQELQESVQELEAFTHTVSHDLRAPLRAVQGFARAIQEDCGAALGSDCENYVQLIVSAAHRMDVLIADLLEYSRIGRREVLVKPISLQTVVEEALQQLEAPIAESRAEIRLQQDLPVVLGHRPILIQAVTNLIANAIKFVAAGTSPVVRIKAESVAGAERLWVEDNGIGISEEHHQRILRVFERLHGVETYPGTGIGLAIVRRAVDRMHGRMGLESTPGEGTRFWIELPSAVRQEVENHDDQ